MNMQSFKKLLAVGLMVGAVVAAVSFFSAMERAEMAEELERRGIMVDER